MKKELEPIDYYPDWRGWALKEEDILWTGKPSIPYSQLRTDETGMTNNPFAEGLYLMFLVGFYAITLFKAGDIFLGVVLMLTALLYPFLRDYYLYFSISKTKYAIAKDFIIFKFWRFFQYKYYAVPYDQVVKVSLLKDDANRGLIHIVTRDRMEFQTYELESRKRRDHPTFEYVDNPQEAVQLIKKRIKPDPNRKLVYTPPTASFLTLRILRIVLNGLIVLFLLSLVDFFRNGFEWSAFHNPALWIAALVVVFSRIILFRKFMISQELFVRIVILNTVFIGLFLLIWYFNK